MRYIWKIIFNFYVIYGKENISSKDCLKIFFPLLPVEKVHLPSHKTSGIYGVFLSKDFQYIPFYLLSTKKEEEEFFQFINNQRIKTNLVEYIFVIKQQLLPMFFITYTIENKRSINNHLVENIESIEPNITVKSQQIKQEYSYKVRFTPKEKVLILQLFRRNKSIKNLWFIYQHFEQLYGKHFVFFSIDQKEVTLNQGKEYFHWLFMNFVYETILTTLY